MEHSLLDGLKYSLLVESNDGDKRKDQKVALRRLKAIVLTGLILVFVFVVSNDNVLRLFSDVEEDNVGNLSDQVKSLMDLKTDPCEDFYRFSCGNWYDRSKIPASSPFTSRSYQGGEQAEYNSKILHKLLSDGKGLPKQVVKFYNNCMNKREIEELGIKPLEKWLSLINNLEMNTQSFTKIITQLHLGGVQALFSSTVADDLLRPANYLFQVVQGGLGLPSPKFYFDDDELVNDYEKHIGNMLHLIDNENDDSKLVLEVEMWLAKISRPNCTGDYLKSKQSYNKYVLKDLSNVYGNIINWSLYFEKLGNMKNKSFEVNIVQPEYFQKLNVLQQNTFSKQHWVAYFKWQLVHRFAQYLPEKFVQEDFNFFNKRLQGQRIETPRKTQCLKLVNSAPVLGTLLGKAFSETVFGGDSKAKLHSMFSEIRSAFIRDVDELEWLDESTKTYALKKAENMIAQLGYPDSWPHDDIGDIFDGKTFLSMQAKLQEYRARLHVSLSGKPLDPNRWETITNFDELLPQTVSAFNAESPNFMIVPAGIVQPPIYQPWHPVAMQMGGLATTVGHEFTHSFDQIGRKFGADGKLEEWWSNFTATEFQTKAKCLVHQYSQYQPLPGVNLSGSFTEQENIADNGGMRIAYSAFLKMVGKSAFEPSKVEGFTNEQLFFVSFGQQWCYKMTDAYAAEWVQNNQHSTPEFRVKGVLSNLPAFAKAFQCKRNTPYNPDEKCRIW